MNDVFHLLIELRSSNVVAESLWWSSAIAVLLAVVFVGICIVMAIYALINGETETPRMLPQLDGTASFFQLFTAVPVIVTAFTFHFNGKNLSPKIIVFSFSTYYVS